MVVVEEDVRLSARTLMDLGRGAAVRAPPPPAPFSHHNTVFISPLRLKPSLPVRRGKRHFGNEIGYINSGAVTAATAFLPT